MIVPKTRAASEHKTHSRNAGPSTDRTEMMRVARFQLHSGFPLTAEEWDAYGRGHPGARLHQSGVVQWVP